jgi:hypothetical protein
MCRGLPGRRHERDARTAVETDHTRTGRQRQHPGGPSQRKGSTRRPLPDRRFRASDDQLSVTYGCAQILQFRVLSRLTERFEAAWPMGFLEAAKGGGLLDRRLWWRGLTHAPRPARRGHVAPFGPSPPFGSLILPAFRSHRASPRNRIASQRLSAVASVAKTVVTSQFGVEVLDGLRVGRRPCRQSGSQGNPPRPATGTWWPPAVYSR